MAVKLKKKETKNEKLRIVGFGVKDHVAITGTEKNKFFSGKTKVVHVVQAEKLIKSGNAKASTQEIEEIVNPNRQVIPMSKTS